MALSGWCSSPAGFQPQCLGCQWDLCTHTCHNDEKDD